MKKNTVIQIFLSFILIFNISAHQDTVLKISGNKITGLPKIYENVLVNWDNNSITINGKEAKFPDFTANLFKAKKNLDAQGNLDLLVGIKWNLIVQGSWYHDKSETNRLPDYISFNIYPENKDYYLTVTFDLEKSSLVGSTVMLTTFSKDKGDKWINSEEKIDDRLTSMSMELAIDSEDIWDKYKKASSAKSVGETLHLEKMKHL
jgi:hypothetical protein